MGNQNNFEYLSKEFFISTMESDTKARFLELLAAEKRGREDIIYFSEALLGIQLNDYQKKWLTRTTTPRSKWLEKFNETFEDIGGFFFGSNISSIGNQCIQEDEYIYTKDGIRRIGDLKEGDATIAGTAKNFHRFEDDIYEITFSNGIKIRTNKEHPFFSIQHHRRKKTDGEWRRLIDLRVQDYVQFQKAKEFKGLNGIIMPQAKLFGYLCSDGTLTKKQSIKFTNINLSFLKEVDLLCRKYFNIEPVWKKKGKGFDVFLTRRTRGGQNPVRQMVNELGITDSSFGKITGGDTESLKDFMRGYFNGDGYLLIRRAKDRRGCGEIGFAVGDKKKKAYELQYILWRLGITSFVREEWMAKSKSPFYRVKVNSSDTIKMIDILEWTKYPNKFSEAKQLHKTASRHIHNDWIRVRSIKKIGRGFVVGYKTNTEEIISYAGMRTHNSGKTVGIAIKHVWFAKYKIGMELDSLLINSAYYATLNISPHSRQTKACYQHVKDILGGQFIIDEDGKKRLNILSPLMRDFIAGDNANLGEIRFSNKSVMYSVPTGADQASSLAGAQFGYISYDECSQSLHLKEELGAKILSRLIKYGCCLDLIATPEVDSPSHQYYLHIVRLGIKKIQGWWALTGMGMDDNKFIPKEQRDRAKATLLATDKKRYRQVVHGEFITAGKRFFDSAEIENLWKLPSKKDCQRNGKYLLAADWGFADSGDESVFMVLDYTNFSINGKIDIVNHESIRGGSPQMQFSLLRTLYDQYTWYDEDGVTAHPPTFLTDAQGLGGVVIKKLLILLKPKSFDIDKDEALFLTKGAMAKGRDYFESEIDGAVIEKNPDYGIIRSYYIDELNEQLGNYHIEDKKLTTDFTMTLMMGISYILKKMPKIDAKKIDFNPLRGYEANIVRLKTLSK